MIFFPLLAVKVACCSCNAMVLCSGGGKDKETNLIFTSLFPVVIA